MRSLICLSLLTLCAGCATLPAPPVLVRPDPPPWNLALPCLEGPDYPGADVPLGQLLDIVAERESAAAECRARHAALLKAWPK